MRCCTTGTDAVGLRHSSELPTRSLSTTISAPRPRLHRLVRLERHRITHFWFLRRLRARWCILDQLAFTSQWCSASWPRTSEFKYNFPSLGNYNPRLRIGKRADCAHVRLSRQSTSHAESRTYRRCNVGLFIRCSNSPVQQHSANGYRCFSSDRISLSTSFQMCARDFDNLWGRRIFASVLCPGLLTRARLEHLSAREADALHVVEAFRSGAW